MYKLSVDLDRKLEVMSKHSLTAEEWLFIELLWLCDDGQPKYLEKYLMDCRKDSLPLDTLHTLKDKKVLNAKYKIPKPGETFDPDQVEFSRTFINNYFKYSCEAGMELFAAYPPFIQDSDMLLPANNITKGGYFDDQDFFFMYGKAIKNRPENHAEVMRSLEWAKEQKLIKYGICEYVASRKWNTHLELMESGELNGIAYKVNTLEDID